MRTDWRDYAACTGMDTDLWFPVTETPRTRQELLDIRKAKETCAMCPVRRECLTYAFEQGERHGIWGGMSYRERRTRKGRAIGRALVPA